MSIDTHALWLVFGPNDGMVENMKDNFIINNISDSSTDHVIISDTEDRLRRAFHLLEGVEKTCTPDDGELDRNV
jgi:hypothetical protein